MAKKLYSHMTLAVAAAGVALAATAGRAAVISSEASSTDCREMQRHFDHDLAIAYAEEHLSMPASGQVEVKAARNGGVRVIGWNENHYAVTACKAAGAHGIEDARALLMEIKLSSEGRQVGVSGPPGERWSVNLVIHAPRGATMNAEGYNGPISLEGVSGKVSVAVNNGPIALKRCSGEIKVQARNGPISLTESRGNLHLQAENGPISVTLTGAKWEDGELEAQTHNGPLSLQLPAGYQSGVRVAASMHAPIRCDAPECSQAQRNWDNGHHYLEFGNSASPAVRMSTVNGPVSVEAADGSKSDDD